jgi:hypothetical protein
MSLGEKYLNAIFGEESPEVLAARAEKDAEHDRWHVRRVLGHCKGPHLPTHRGEQGEALFWARPSDFYPNDGAFFFEDGTRYFGTVAEHATSIELRGPSDPVRGEWLVQWRGLYNDRLGPNSEIPMTLDEAEEVADSTRLEAALEKEAARIEAARAEKAARKAAKPQAAAPVSPWAALAALKI